MEICSETVVYPEAVGLAREAVEGAPMEALAETFEVTPSAVTHQVRPLRHVWEERPGTGWPAGPRISA